MSKAESVEEIRKNPSVTTQETLGPPPDGGLTAWLQVFGGFFCIFNSWGLTGAFGAFLEYYKADLLRDTPDSTISWVGALQACFCALGCVIFAPLLDAGYLIPLAYAATLIQTFGLMMLSLCKEFYQVLLCQGVVVGLGGSIFFLVASGMVSPWFSERRNFAIGVTAVGTSVGGVIYPIALRRLISEVDFPWTARILAFIVLGTGACTCAVARRRTPPRPSPGIIDVESFRDVPFVVWSLGLVTGYICVYSIQFYAQTYAVEEFGVMNGLTYYTTPVMNAASTFGRLIPSFMADRYGPFNVLIPCIMLCTILSFAWIAVTNLAGFWIMAGFFGFASAPIVSMPAAVAAKMTPNLNKLGVRLGFSLMFASIGIVLGAPMGGIILRNHGWLWFKIFSGIAGVVTTFVFIVCRQTQVGRRTIVAKI